MAKGYMQEIRERVLTADDGSIFIASDFADIADPDAVAKALARSYYWTIAPCGNTALNLLGLSAQVTAV